MVKEYILAKTADIETVFNIVQNSIKTTYPKYYPKEVVEFFSNLHSRENILKDITMIDICHDTFSKP